MHIQSKAYGIESHIINHGIGENLYRDEFICQPRTLAPGDVLANGYEISGQPTEEGNGCVGLHFTDEKTRIVPARIPLLLAGGEYGKHPLDLRVGDILATGCVVLSHPTLLSRRSQELVRQQREVIVNVTGGHLGHNVDVPVDLVVALHTEAYPPSTDTLLGRFTVDKVMDMHIAARRNLPNSGSMPQ